MEKKSFKHLIATIFRSPNHSQIAIILASLLLIFISWRIALWTPLQNKKVELNHKFKTSITILNTTQLNIAKQQEELKKKQASMPKTTETQKPQITHSFPLPQNISQTLQSLLSAKAGLSFISMHALPTKSKFDSISHQQLFEHDIIIKFNGSYFPTIDYIKTIEGLNWPIYWDKLDYIVTQYPHADITLQVHTLSQQEDIKHE